MSTRVKAGRRQQKALETRRRMLEAAGRLFADDGYIPTTMAAIAHEAGVAVQTVHFTFHTKAQLLSELIRVVSSGADDPLPVMERAWAREALATRDSRRTVALSVEHGTDIFSRMAPMRPTIETAATLDAEVHKLWTSIGESRRRGIRRLLEAVAARGDLKNGLDVDRATDIMSVVHSHDTYLALVRNRGWSLSEYKAWQFEVLCEQLLAPKRGHRNAGRGDATAGLSYANLLPFRWGTPHPHED